MVMASVWLCICRATCVLVAVSVKSDCTRVFVVGVCFIAQHVFASWFLCVPSVSMRGVTQFACFHMLKFGNGTCCFMLLS